MCRRRRPSCRPSSLCCRCSCWPTGSLACAGSTSTSRATWPRPSPSSSRLQDSSQHRRVIPVAVAGLGFRFREPGAGSSRQPQVEPLLEDQVCILPGEPKREARWVLAGLDRGPPSFGLGGERGSREHGERALTREAEGVAERERLAEYADHADEGGIRDELRGG